MPGLQAWQGLHITYLQMRILLIATISLFTSVAAMAQWENINQGFGGQVQDVALDPQRPGRMIFHSDMEGHYISTDYAQSWHFIGHELKHPFSMTSAFDPTDEKIIYTGTVAGLHISRDGGHTWEFAQDIGEISIDNIYVNPSNPSQVFAGQGLRVKPPEAIKKQGFPVRSKRVIYRSQDKGKSWESISYSEEEGLMQTFNFVIPQNDPQTVWLGASAGIYKSEDGGKSWELFPSPPEATFALGMDISPDGQRIYACYTTDAAQKEAHVFTSPTDKASWADVSDHGFNLGDKKIRWWRPQVDPRSTNGTDHVLLGTGQNGKREGLYEGTFKWKKDQLKDYGWERIFWYQDGWQYDVGWDDSSPGAFTFYYSPPSWPRQIWATGMQTWFMGDPEHPNWPKEGWYNRYSKPVDTFDIAKMGHDKIITYTHRGAACTFDFDIVAHQNYILQCQADNGYVESWDFGKSWTNDLRPYSPFLVSKSEAADIAPLQPHPIVVAHGMLGFGASGNKGGLFIKELKDYSPADDWKFIAGSPDTVAGIGPQTIFKVKVDPHNPNQVYLGQIDNGILQITDLQKYISTQDAKYIKHITQGTPIEGYSIYDLAVDHKNPNTIYATARWPESSLWRGTKGAKGKWDFELIVEQESSSMNHIRSWQDEGQHYMAYTHVPQKNENTQGDVVMLSTDGGKSWNTVMSPQKVFELRKNKWYGQADIEHLNSGGLAVYKNHLFVCYYNWSQPKVAYGYFHGVIQADGTVRWEDYTGNLEFPIVRRAHVYEKDDKPYLYLATQGTGAWRRKIEP